MTGTVRPDWFEVANVGNGVTVIREVMRVEDVKSFLIEGDQDVAVLDTGMGVGDFRGLVARLSDKQPIVLHSHAHWDHIGDSHRFDHVLVHPSEAGDLQRGEPHEAFAPNFGPGRIELDRLPEGFDPETAFIPGTAATGYLNHGDRIDLGNRMLEAFHTPGHTSGGITLLDRQSRTLFPGDAINLGQLYLFAPNSDPVGYRETLRILDELSASVDLLRPSHGPEITPEDVREIRAAYEQVWAGEKVPDEHKSLNVGLPQNVEVDFFRFGRFEFLIETGTYGGATSS